MKKILIFLLTLGFSLNMYAQSQNIPGYKEFANRFGKNDALTMQKLQADILESMTRLQQIQKEEAGLRKYFSRKRKLEKKSVPLKLKWIAAYKLYMTAMASVYDMYDSWLNQASYSDKTIQKQVTELASQADIDKSRSQDIFGKYDKKRDKKSLKKVVKYQKMKVDLAAAAKGIETSLNEMVKALKIVFAQQELSNKDNQAWAKAQSTNTFDGYVTYIKDFPTGAHVQEAKVKIREFKDKIAAERKKMEKYNATIDYRIQIVAVSKKLSSWKKRRLYKDVNAIEEELDPVDGLYKYFVGHYQHYNEAKQFAARLGIPDAFVVSYKNGQKAPILEVLEIEKNKKQ